ncbi:MAG: hypothetical protein ABIN95_06390 [Mucilaginibacter sp.]
MSAQTYSKLIKDTDIASTLDDIIGTRDVLVNTRIFVDKKVLQSDSLSKYFSKADIAFLNQQLLAFKSATWKYPLFKRHTLVNDNEVKLDDANRPPKIVDSFSVPLFSIDMKRIVVIKAFFCGLVCGGGASYIYENKNDKWIMLSEYKVWAE